MKYGIQSLNMDLYNKEFFVEKLERLAKKGWILKKIWVGYGVFEKEEPRELHYSIEIFEPAKKKKGFLNVDFEENEEEAYIELCEQASWNYIGKSGVYFVFCSEQLTATPIQTDPSLEFHQLKNKFFNYFLPLFTLWMILIVNNFKNVMFHLFSYEDYLSCFALSIVPISILVLAYGLLPILADAIWLFWKWRGKKAKNFLIIKGVTIVHRWIFRLIWILFFIAFCLDSYYKNNWTGVMLLGVFLVILVCFLLGMYYWNKKIKEQENKIIIRYVVFFGVLILGISFGMGMLVSGGKEEEGYPWNAKVTITNLLGEGKTIRQSRQESPVLEAMTYEGQSNNYSLAYTIYRSKAGEGILKQGFESEKLRIEGQEKLFGGEGKTITKENWGAKEVYGIVGNNWSTTIERLLLVNETDAIWIQVRGDFKEEERPLLLNRIKEELVIPLLEEE
ncbi:MAG: DUF2812 domain-containing protein [Clostridiales bacterium]|nr:DUF2812 domain-containing protein [Clostridiales bacterium]